jgi:cell division FtsZ-interacting protein ZapD
MEGVNYRTLGMALRVIADACFEADRQQRSGEKVTVCGMSDEDLESLCEQLPYLMNPMMSTEEVKDKLRVSDATLNRMVARGDIPNGESKKRGHTRYWKKWDILHYLRRRKNNR